MTTRTLSLVVECAGCGEACPEKFYSQQSKQGPMPFCSLDCLVDYNRSNPDMFTQEAKQELVEHLIAQGRDAAELEQ
jgi:endogenous inhibitor of DNA gyrase (YacG/DUF329 family)